MRRGLITYLSVTFALGYVLELASVQLGLASGTGIAQLLVAATMFTPLIGAISARRGGVKGLREVVGRVKSRRLILWYLIVPLLVLIHYAIATVLSLALGFPLLNPEEILEKQLGRQVPSLPALLISSYVAAITINALLAFGEEAGWRGYLYLEMREKLGLLGSGALVGVIWALWHAPLILLAGYNYPVHRLEGLVLFVFWCSFVSLILFLIRERSESVLPCASIHGALNAFSGLELMTVPSPSDLIRPPVGIIGLLSWALIAITMISVLRGVSRPELTLARRLL